MVADRSGDPTAVKYEIVIDGKAAALSIAGESFEYQREGGTAIEHQHSAAPAGDGTWSILIDGRSYSGCDPRRASEALLVDNVFHVDLFDPQ